MCVSHLEYVNQLVQNDLKYVFNYDFRNFGPAKSHIKKSLWDIAPEILMLSEERRLTRHSATYQGNK